MASLVSPKVCGVSIRRLKMLCRGDADSLAGWIYEASWQLPFLCAGTIIAGCGIYGWTLGLWRAPAQAVFTALKFPLLIFLTCGGNVLLNGLLAQLLGAGLTFRQTSLAILMSFTIAALVLGAFAPLTLFLLWNTPPLARGSSITGHSIMLLAHVGLIAYAGVIANSRLLRLLQRLTADQATALKVLFAWLAGNLFLGSQISWILRPFIGSPALPIQFLRDDPLRGNFFEAVYHAARHLIS